MLARRDFPPGFVFGAATSAYQIEGQSLGGAGPTHWDAFARKPGAIADGSDAALACAHYHRYEEDLDLLRGFDAYRFSVNWARVLPEGTGSVNARGLDFYDRLVDAMLARGLAAYATLYHWELPQALAERGGWSRRDTAHRFADFCEIVIRRIGDRLSAVATVNEPHCIAWLGHFEGVHAPGLRHLPTAARAMHHVLLAHGEALARLRALGQQNLGIVLNLADVAPAEAGARHRDAARRHDALLNRWFVEALLHGRYPAPALAGLRAHLPGGWQADMDRISRPLDWLGVNYYTRQLIAAEPGAPWPALREVPGPLQKTAMGWEVFPEGLTRVLLRIARRHPDAPPIVVTENGIALEDRPIGGRIDDRARCAFIARHLEALRRALDAGADIRGFFFWSLLDNYEWAQGYGKRFGLVHVDFDTMKRTAKRSMTMLQDALATH